MYPQEEEYSTALALCLDKKRPSETSDAKAVNYSTRSSQELSWRALWWWKFYRECNTCIKHIQNLRYWYTERLFHRERKHQILSVYTVGSILGDGKKCLAVRTCSISRRRADEGKRSRHVKSTVLHRLCKIATCVEKCSRSNFGNRGSFSDLSPPIPFAGRH